MIKEYRKKATIKAEQFDGSIDMMREYSIKANAGFPLYMLLTREEKMEVHKGDWIVTGIDGEHWAIADNIFRRTYEEVNSNE